MSDDTAGETRESGTRHRGPLTWLVAAAAAAVIAGVAGYALLGPEDAAGPTAGPSPAEPTSAAAEATQLTMPARGGGRCMVPNARVLGDAAYALDGEVVSIDGGVVTLAVEEWYVGGQTDEVRVDQGSADRTALVGAPRFEVGGRYLVAGGDDGDVMVCGFSGAHTPDLAALYAEAFGA